MKIVFYKIFILLFPFVSYCNVFQNNDSIPKHESFTLPSQKLGEERVVNIWTPSVYQDLNVPLPVMYMLDGGIKEDFPHIANTLAKLIDEKKIKPLILVGIENTQRRRDLTGFTAVAKDKEIAPVVGGSENFRVFINEELIPEINRRYKTNAIKSLIGESLAGLFVMETFFLFSEMFDHYIAFDPSLWWNNHYLVQSSKVHLAKTSPKQKSLWFAGSDATDISKHTKSLEQILQKSKPKNLRWKYADEPKEKHSTIFRATKEKAITWALGNEK